MRVEFFNGHPEGARILKTAFDGNIGKTVALTKDGEQIGTATIVAVRVEEDGVYITYDTHADLGIMMELEIGEDPQ